jgi:hypothetical protein
MIKKDSKLTKIGISTNIIGGRTLKTLIDNNVKVVVLKELNCSGQSVWEDSMIKETFQENKKDFNVHNGITGKVTITQTTVVEIKNQTELQAILEDHDDIVQYSDDTLACNYSVTKYVNLLHRYLAVLDASNANVLKVLFKIGKPVTKIVTDSLSFDEPVIAPVGWKSESFKHRQATTCDMKVYKVSSSQVYDNSCLLGAPGTGKTYHTKRNTKYDYASGYTNKAANNTSTDDIKGQTLHRLFNIYTDGKGYRLKDKTVWVDEISMIPRYIWGYMVDAYMNYNTRFIFTGDFNQTAPVGESKLEWIPFMGNITTFTKDYRNSDALVTLRDSIINGTPVKVTKSTSDYPLINIAFTNKTCERVNTRIVERESFVWGAIGTTVCSRISIKTSGIAKNECFVIESINGNHIKFVGVEHTITTSVLSKHFTWGYCMTVHKAQGDTITTDIGIHDWDRMPVDVKYTAVTRALDVNQIHWY